MLFRRFVLNQRDAPGFNPISLSEIDTRPSSLFLSLFFFLFLSSCLLKVEWLSKQIVIRPVACMNLYLLKLRISSGNGSSFEKVNERSKGTFSTSQGDFRPGRRTKVLSHCSMIYVSIGLSSGILK